MSLLSRIRNFFGGEPLAPPALRNKPQGMAFINKAVDENDGAAVLINRIVCTRTLSDGGNWIIDPPQPYSVTRWVRSGSVVAGPGDHLLVTALPDCALTPIRDIGDSERSEERLFQPPVPAGEPKKVKA